MKCSIVGITLNPDDAKLAAVCLLLNEEDLSVLSEAEVEAYQGPTFEENELDCRDLHVVYRDGFACVNFINERGERVNYDYPIQSLKRIKRITNDFVVH